MDKELVNKLIMLPGPTNVHERVRKAMVQPSIYHRGEQFHKLYARIEEDLKYVFQTQNDVFILTSSGTGANECVIANTVSPGDKVLVCVNGFFGKRLMEIVKKKGGIPIEISAEWGKGITSQAVKEALDRIPDAKAVILVSNETSTGVLNQVEKIAEVVDHYDKLFITDSISHVGGAKLSVDKWKIDICVAASQKCLACPPGLAFLSVSDEAWKVIEKNRTTSDYFDLLKYRDYHEKNETVYTPAVPIFFALGESLRMIREETINSWLRRHKRCSEILRRGIKKLGLNLLVKNECLASPTVTSIIKPEGINIFQARRLMSNKHGIVVAGGLGKLRNRLLRIGTMGVVRESYVEKTLLALRDILEQLKY